MFYSPLWGIRQLIHNAAKSDLLVAFATFRWRESITENKYLKRVFILVGDMLLDEYRERKNE